MSNVFFEAVCSETDPMYDAAIVSDSGEEYWHNPSCNYSNNSHSATKLFVATAIGILVDRDLLSLSTPVLSLFLPDEIPEDTDENWKNVTVKDTLQHKTGFEYVPFNVDNDNDIEKIGPDFLRYVFSLKIEHEPGSFRKYSDEAYYLLGRIIEKASGVSSVDFIRDNITKPLNFRQWAIALCPKGHIIAGGGFYTRADDMARLGFTYACDGMYRNKRIISSSWVRSAMENDYALTRFRDTDVFVKTGAHGQMIAFSSNKRTGVAWHGFSLNGNERNDRLLEAFVKYIYD